MTTCSTMNNHNMKRSEPSDTIIELNVSGRVYPMLRSSLVRIPGLLQRMLSDGEFQGEPVRDAHGRVFLARDADAFGVVVNYLTTAVARVPPNVPLHVADAELAYFFPDAPPAAYTDDMIVVEAMPEVRWFIQALTVYLRTPGSDVQTVTLTNDSHITVRSRVFKTNKRVGNRAVYVSFANHEPWWCGHGVIESPLSSTLTSMLWLKDVPPTFSSALQQVLRLHFRALSVYVCADRQYSHMTLYLPL